MRISFVSRGDARKTVPDQMFEGSFEEFASLFKNYTPGRGKHDGYFVRGELKGKRSNANLPTADVLILDGDQTVGNEHSAPDPVKLHKALKLARINHFFYSSHSYAPPDKMKWRCVIECPMGVKEQLKPTLNQMFEWLAEIKYPLVNVKENWTWSQAWFLPNRDEDDGHYIYLTYFDGEPYSAAEPVYDEDSTPSAVIPRNSRAPTNKEGSHRDNLAAIREGVSYYKELQSILWGFARDGRAKDAALGDIEMIMYASKAASPNHEGHDKWAARMKELPTYVEQAYNATKTEEISLDDLPELTDKTVTDVALDWPPGLMGKLCKDFYDMAPHPNQEISIIGGVCLVAGIVGRKFNVMGTGLNLYGTLLADSGIGKAILKDGINLALRSANAMHGALYVGSSRFTGPKAVFEMLTAGHSRVCVLEESGLMNESQAGDQSGLNRVMLDLYTSSGAHQWAGGEAYSDKNNSIKAIQAPALTLLNVSTPKSYLKAMKTKSAELSGELARMWIIRSIKPKPYLNVTRKKRFSEDCIERISELVKYCLDRQTPEAMGEVIEVLFDPVKAQEDSNHFVDQENFYRENGDHLRRTLCSRAFVKMMKLASVVSVFNGHDMVGDEEYEWAKTVIGHEMTFVQDTFTHEASDDMGNIVKSIILPVIVKMLKAQYTSGVRVPPEKLRKAGGFSFTNISQATNSNVVVRELDDEPSRPNPKKGIEKILDYMVRAGFLVAMDKKELRLMGVRSYKGYRITDDLKLMLREEVEEGGLSKELKKAADGLLSARKK